MIESLSWIGVRALGITAYLALSVEVLLGLALSTGYLDPWARRPWVATLHRVLSVTALLTVAGHALLLLADRTVQFSWVDLLVPFASSYRPFAIALGVFGLYALVTLEVSSWLRRWTGGAPWRRMHAISFGLYIAATFHGILSGSDSGRWPLGLLYLGSAGAVSFMIFLRLFLYVTKSARRRPESTVVS